MRMLALGRTIGSVVLVLLACLLVPVATTAVWLRTTVSDTDRWVATVGPLAEEPAVQTYVADRLREEVMAAVDRSGVVQDAVDRLVEQQGLPPRVGELLVLALEPVRDRLDTRVGELADQLVRSDAFAQAWRDSNQTAHRGLIEVLEGGDEDGGVTLNLATVANALRLSLVERQVPFADRLPEVQASVPLAGEEELVRVRTAYRRLDAWAGRLAALAVLLPVAGIALARRRRRALVAWLVGSAVVVVLVLLGLVIARDTLTGGLENGGVVARAVVDVLTDRLRWVMGAWVAVLLAAAAIVVATGPGPRATATRERARTSVASMRSTG